MIDASVIDGPHLLAHWEQSVYGRLWNDPLFAARREVWTAQLTAMQSGVGMTLKEFIQGMNGLGMQVMPPSAGHQLPEAVVEGDLGALAGRVMQIVHTMNADPTALKDIKIAGASEALDIIASETRLARFNGILVMSDTTSTSLRPWKPAALPAQTDVSVHIDATRLLAALPAAQAAQVSSLLQPLAHALGGIDYRLELVPEGMHERLTSHATASATVPVDRDLLSHLPGNTLLTLAIGVDGAAFWKEQHAALLSQYATLTGAASEAAAEQQLNQQLSALGLTATLAQLVEGMHGTIVITVTPGFPFPSPTIMLPRSPAFDQVIALVLKLIQVTPPAEGQGTQLPIPGLPIPVTLAAAKQHWLLSSDAALVDGVLNGKPGGWNDSPAGKAALAHAPATATLIGASDTPKVLATLSSFAALGLNQNVSLEPEDKKAALQALSRLGALASTGWLVSYTESGSSVLEDRGLIGFGPFILGAVSAALKNADAVGDTAHGDPAITAVSTLSTEIFPAEQAFQKAAYIDQDGDGHGEFGFISELSGVRATPNSPIGVLQLIDSQLAAGPVEGFTYAIFLPDGKGGALGEPAAHGPRHADPAAAKDQAKRFVAYAWPTAAGGRMYAITEAGVLFSAPATGHAPVWNDLFAGAGWDTAPTWPRYQPEARTKAAAPGTF
jgi:hypothetical protein